MTLTRFDKDTQVKDLAGGLNDNSDIIEDHFDAINPHPQGRLVLDVSGDQDINLTAEQARSGQLIFTGVLTGNINVFAPCSYMVYHVQNQTSGDYTLTIKTGAGNGVLIQQASLPNYPRIKRVLCDGSNIVWADGSQIVEDNLHEEIPDNGHYVRFADGRQVCTHILATANTDQETIGSLYFIRYGSWTFPQPFIDTPSISMSIVTGIAQMPGNRQISATGVTEFYGYRGAAFTGGTISSQKLAVMAIGRWR